MSKPRVLKRDIGVEKWNYVENIHNNYPINTRILVEWSIVQDKDICLFITTKSDTKWIRSNDIINIETDFSKLYDIDITLTPLVEVFH
jgi:hypothetical protein